MSAASAVVLGGLGYALVAVPAWLTARRLALGSLARTVLAAAVIAWAWVVVVAEGLSLVGAFARWPLWSVTAAACLAALGAHRLRPAPPAPRPGLHGRWRRLPGDYRAVMVVVAATAAASLLLAVVVTPNNADSMVYHLSRAAYWVQEQSVFHFRGAGARQAAMPPGAEIVIAWQMALTHRDTTAQVLQWLCYLLAAVGVFELARLLGARTRPALFGALVFLALPQPFLQSATTQNDLAVTALLLATAVFGGRALAGPRARGHAAMAGLAAGLALATKSTAIIVVPLIGLGLLIVAYRRGTSRRLLALLAGAAVLAAAALAVPNYAQNLADFGRLTAPESFTERGAGGGAPVAPRPGQQAANVVRMTWSSFVETTPFDPGGVGSALTDTGRAIAPGAEHSRAPDEPELLVFQFAVGSDIDEDFSGYGLLGLLVLLPCLVWTLWRGTRVQRLTVALLLVGVVGLALNLRYSEANGRILMPFAAAACAFVGVLDRRVLLRGVVLGVAGAGLIVMLLGNPSKPLLPLSTRPTLFSGLDRLQVIGLRNAIFATAVADLNRRIGDRAPVGVLGRETSYDYPLFGDPLRRKVYRVVPGQDDQRRGIVDGHRVRAIVYADAQPLPPGSTSVLLAPGQRAVLFDR